MNPQHFDLPVRPGGYAWWYVDGLSDDGKHGLTIIMFIGSVFSSRYAKARTSAPAAADPTRFCAVNVALYDLAHGDLAHGDLAHGDLARGRRLWVMHEHGSHRRDRDALQIGASTIRWQDGALQIDLDERQTRFFGRVGPAVRGRVRVRPSAVFGPRVELDHWRAQPRHRWYPVAPHARLELELDAPALRFTGSAYHDVNEGDEGLEQGFASWNWARCELGERTVISYDVVDPEGQAHARAWRFEPGRELIEDIPSAQLGPPRSLPGTRWGLSRAIRCDPQHAPTLAHTLEDTPFYSRNLVRVHLDGREGLAVHESIALRRFAQGWVRFLLPFKTRVDRAK